MTERVELLELKMEGVELTFVCKGDVVGLELAVAGGLGLGEDNGAAQRESEQVRVRNNAAGRWALIWSMR